MGRISSVPIQYDDLKTLEISKFKGWGYLKGDKAHSFEVSWSRNGQKTASVGCCININERKMQLNYWYNGVSCYRNFLLASKPSNLGNGEVYYFVCRKSNKWCRKLYLYNGEFVHRSMIRAYYFSQLVPVKERGVVSMYRKSINYERLLDESYEKHYRKYYKGKITKRYSKLLSIYQ